MFFFDVDVGIVINVYVMLCVGGDVYVCGEGCEVFEDDLVEFYVLVGVFFDVFGMFVDEV